MTAPRVCELHCHSNYSRDCDLSIEAIITTCKARGITVVALTDHNEIAGALALKAAAPDWLEVIVGEEIATAQGDLIGLFLTEKIAPRQDIETTIELIHQQGGLALLPHPFDRIRHEAVGAQVLEQVKNKVDAVEIFNARCLFPGDNRKAAAYVRANKLVPFVGSDAHVAREYGRATCTLSPFHDAASFLESLKNATFTTRVSSPLVHVSTKVVKLRKRRSAQ